MEHSIIVMVLTNIAPDLGRQALMLCYDGSERREASPLFNTILFDLDGTLVDTAPDITRAVNAVLAPLDIAPFCSEAVRTLVGQGGRALVEHALEAAGMAPDEARIDTMVERLLESYGDNIATASRPFPAVEATLEDLGRNGSRLGICTNKPGHLATRLIGALKLARHFAAIVGGDEVDRRKPHPGHILEALRRCGGDTASGVMVGDSIHDVSAARAAGIPVIVVSFGYSQTPAGKLGADRVIDHFAELPAALVSLA